MTRKRSSGKGPGRSGPRRVPEYGCLVVFMAFALAVGGLFFIACGGVNPPPLDCRVLGCDPGSVCEEVDGTYRCVPVPPCKPGECPEGQICVDGKCEPKPPWECELPMPGCHEVGQTCSTAESPCWHNPTSDPEHCEEAPACGLPQPQCQGDSDCDCYKGQTWKPCELPQPQCKGDACDCYVDKIWRPCEEPGECTLGTPKASETPGAKIVVQRISRKIVGSTPKGRFGKAYYCTNEADWPEACAEGRESGPVAREGHPQRVACEARFMEQPCPTYSAHDAYTHISFDPWFMINGVNQNHPVNVAAGCGEQFVDHESWVKEKHEGRWYIQSGMWLRAMIAGNTKVKVCMANGTICDVSSFRVDN